MFLFSLLFPSCLEPFHIPIPFLQSAFVGTSISLTSFKEEFGLTEDTPAKLATISANIVSMYQAGSFFGAFAGYPLGYYFGRKWGLVLSTIVFCVGAAIQCAASHKTGLGIMYTGRIIVGFCIGIASNLTVSIFWSAVWILEDIGPTSHFSCLL